MSRTDEPFCITNTIICVLLLAIPIMALILSIVASAFAINNKCNKQSMMAYNEQYMIGDIIMPGERELLMFKCEQCLYKYNISQGSPFTAMFDGIYYVHATIYCEYNTQFSNALRLSIVVNDRRYTSIINSNPIYGGTNEISGHYGVHLMLKQNDVIQIMWSSTITQRAKACRTTQTAYSV